MTNTHPYGFLDLPFMMAEIWKRRWLAIRGLGEHAHYAVPLWRDLLAEGGMVRGTRDNVRALMRDRQTILVFPGGSREVNKRRGQRVDDTLDVIVDQNTPIYGQLARGYEKLMGFPTPPVVRGVGLTPFPRLDRLYFWLGEPIDSARFGSRFDDAAGARALRDEVKQAILTGIQFLRDERDQNPNQGLRSRVLRRVE